MYQIVLLECFDVSHQDIVWVKWEEGKQTWISSWSDCQSSILTLSVLFGARTVEQNFPPKMRFSGDSTDST